MHQIDGAGATAENTFTEGDAQQAIPATQVTAEWLTAVQEELVAIAEHNGGVLDKEDNGQVLAKIVEISSSFTQFGLGDVKIESDDADELIDPGFYATVDAAENNPPFNNAYIFVNGNESGSTVQLAISSSEAKIAFRTYFNSAWQPWVLLNTDSGLGAGQTWQNLLSTRAVNVTYTNSTGKSIMVCVAVNSTNTATNNYAEVNGIKVAEITDSVSGDFFATATFIVPDGAMYQWVSGSASPNLKLWSELR